MLRLLTSPFCSQCAAHRIFRCFRSVRGIGSILASVAVASLLTTLASAQPANDNFANAQQIAGANGTVSGSNVGATTEDGEPDITGVSAAASIWYTWTAQSTGAATFDTLGSTSPGGSLDTRLAIYTGTALDSLALVGENDDALNGATVNSSVTVAVTAGKTYIIAVDGFSSSDQGSVVLNWSTGGLWAGDFHFTSSFYNFSEFDSFPPTENKMGFITNRFTITRTGGSAGRVLINYTVTNGFYRDIHITNVFGTNLLFTNIDNMASITYFTNITSTNFTTIDRLQNMEY